MIQWDLARFILLYQQVPGSFTQGETDTQFVSINGGMKHLAEQ